MMALFPPHRENTRRALVFFVYIRLMQTIIRHHRTDITKHPYRRVIRDLFGALVFCCTALVLSCGSDKREHPAPVSAGTVTFAVFGNTGLVLDGGSALSSLADALGGHDVAFAVDLGNRLPPGVPSSGIGALRDAIDKDLRPFSAPIYPVAGATDIFDYDSDIDYAARYGPSWYCFIREGVRFVVLNTEDESYRYGFGVSACVGDDQLEWLAAALREGNASFTVIFMHRPLWETDPVVWHTVLRPVLEDGGVGLIVTCFDEGLFDWGVVDGFRAVSSGCTGPVDDKGPGLYPHMLIVGVNGDDVTFGVLGYDGGIRDSIGIDAGMRNRIYSLAASLAVTPFETDTGWNISETRRIVLTNPFDTPITGRLSFEAFRGTSWSFDPRAVDISVAPGLTGTYRLTVRAVSPEMGPPPLGRLVLGIGGIEVIDTEMPVRVRIPEQRTGDPVTTDAGVAAVLPYGFDGRPLRIPVDISGPDACGRCIIYRDNGSDVPECVYISPLLDFRQGINEFSWNGRDLEGAAVVPDSLVYRVFVYNKKAPATWVAEGPESLFGASSVERSLAGLSFFSHNSRSILEWRIGGSRQQPSPRESHSLDSVLDGLDMTGYAIGDGNRLYLLTDAGIVCVLAGRNGAEPDPSFGEAGYVRLRFPGARRLGCIAYQDGLVYAGVGGGTGFEPGIVLIDGGTGEERGFIGLGGLFGEAEDPPAFAATIHGLFCAHPGFGAVARLTLFGETLWVSDPESWVLGADADGLSYIHGFGVDGDGFSYMNTPGTSARCTVMGPDGIGLFRVILVSLPGLRVSHAVPMIEGMDTDGLYFVTRGGDRPYVFHVPFTVRKGLIIDESLYTAPEQ